MTKTVFCVSFHNNAIKLFIDIKDAILEVYDFQPIVVANKTALKVVFYVCFHVFNIYLTAFRSSAINESMVHWYIGVMTKQLEMLLSEIKLVGCKPAPIKHCCGDHMII